MKYITVFCLQLKENLPIRIRTMADFDYIGLGCHSAGCGPTFDMVKLDPSMYKVIFISKILNGSLTPPEHISRDPESLEIVQDPISRIWYGSAGNLILNGYSLSV